MFVGFGEVGLSVFRWRNRVFGAPWDPRARLVAAAAAVAELARR